jgi:serine/threonine protein kinase/Tol biopolymer transport system component
MEPERWRQIESLYHAALEQDPRNRGAYLLDRCSDASLRREVDQLLELDGHAEDFIETPALEIASQELADALPRLTVAQCFDRYRILAFEGAGGMGEVYTAKDSRLGRTVALKFLLDQFAGEAERQERFRQEATTLSLLNHPNICVIHDVGEAQGRTFIAMEYVSGKRLDQLIAGEALPLNDVLNYALQISAGLACAHGAGIIHRDLKPANIMVTGSGHVKLLDFGLAKRAELQHTNQASLHLTGNSHTTLDGIIAGTVAYMSPEQAAGKKLDARSDIFSFGSVLYEMIGGRRAFGGQSNIATLSAILHDEPLSLSSLSRRIPHELETIVDRCLRKDPASRFQNATELRLALEDIQVHGAQSGPANRRVIKLLLAVCTLTLAALGYAIARLGSVDSKPGAGLVITRLTADSGLTANPAISPDGKIVVYASDRGGQDNLDIWVQQVAGGSAVRLTTNPADESQPDISPDGSRIVFRSSREGGGIYSISSLGGEERLVFAARQASSPRFSPDGNSIAFSVGLSSGTCKIFVISAKGGPAKELTTQVPWGMDPIWSPDGKHLMFLGSLDPLGFSSYDWWVAPVEGGRAINTGALSGFEQNGLTSGFDSNRVRGQDELHTITLRPRVWKRDRLIFSANVGDSTNVWQVGIEDKTWRIQQPPQRLTTGSSQEFSPSLSDDGQLVFATIDQRLSLRTLPIQANTGRVTGRLEALTETDANSLRPSISHDGRRLVFVSDRSGNSELWLRDMDTGRDTALTATPWAESHPYITGDGSKVFYLSLEKPKEAIYVMSLDDRIPRKFCDDCGLPMGWSSDGGRLFFHQRQTRGGAWRSIDVLTRQRMNVIRHDEYNLHMLRLSFDGKWLAFHVPMPAGLSPVLIAPLRESFVNRSEWIEVTGGKGADVAPWWSPDGGILYFLSRRDGFQCIWAQRLDRVTKRPVGNPVPVEHFHNPRHRLREVGFGPAVSAEKLVFTVNDTKGNVWITRLNR